MKVAGTAFRLRVEFVYPDIGRDPQIAVIVFHHVLQKVGAQTAGIVRVAFVYGEGVAVVTIEAVPGGKPHEAPAVLQHGDDITLRKTIVGGEVREFEVLDPSMDLRSIDILRVARSRVGS